MYSYTLYENASDLISVGDPDGARRWGKTPQHLGALAGLSRSLSAAALFFRADDPATMSETMPLLGSGRDQPKDKVSGFFWLCIFVSALGAFYFGFSLGYSSPTMAANIGGQNKTLCVLPDAVAPDDGSAGSGGLAPLNPANTGMLNCDLRLSSDMVGWFGSVVNIGCLVGALMGGKFVDLVGKKMGMATSFVFYTAGWLCLALAPKGETVTEEDQTNIVVLLIASRLIVGFAIGIVCCSVSNYQTEIATTEIRGTIGTVFQLAITIGLVVA